MRVMAHIPTQTYGFVEVEGTDQELPRIEELYNKYSEKPLAFRGAPELVSSEDTGKVITTFTGAVSYTHLGKGGHDGKAVRFL